MYPSIINKSMKKSIFILLIGLLNCQLFVFAVNQKKIKFVSIYSDTTIVVRELFGPDCKLYGDKILLDADKKKVRSNNDGRKKDTKTYIRYGGDCDGLFGAKMKEANNNKEEYEKYVSRNKNDGIVINLCYDSIPITGLELNFYGVLYDSILVEKKNSNKELYLTSNEWYRDKNNIYSISIKKDTIATGTLNPLIACADSTSTGELDSKPTLTTEVHNWTERILIILVLLIICLFIVIFVRINKLNKRINSFLNIQIQPSPKSKDINIEEIKQTVISKIRSDELVQRISNQDIYSVVNRSEIQQYIQTIIAGKVDEYLRNNKVSYSIPSNITVSNQQSPKVQPELRTTKVEYRAENNCFVLSENSQNKIFEIYSKNGEYYYTIVKDPSIRKEMLGFITAFSGYVETRLGSPIPSTVEVIRDGRLIKNDDMYVIDTNCILQVSLM